MVTTRLGCLLLSALGLAGALRITDNSSDECDMGIGSWQAAPLEPEPYISKLVEPKWRCPSKSNWRWTWVPRDCALPEWNPKKILKLAAHHPLVMVGDSLIRNQWISFRAMLMTATHKHSKVMKNITVFKERYWGIKWDENSDAGDTLYLDERMNFTWAKTMPKHAVVVLGGGQHLKKDKNRYIMNRVETGNPGTDVNVEAYRMAMLKVLRGLEFIGFRGTVILESMSPVHFIDADWDAGGACRVYKRPISSPAEQQVMFRRLGSTSPASYEAANQMLRSLKSNSFKVRYLDITTMSWLRPEAHPDTEPHPEKSDCMHWCLPGVPDIWNRALLQVWRSAANSTPAAAKLPRMAGLRRGST